VTHGNTISTRVQRGCYYGYIDDNPAISTTLGPYDINSYRTISNFIGEGDGGTLMNFGGDLYPPGNFAGNWQTTSAVVANRMYAFPFILPLKTIPLVCTLFVNEVTSAAGNCWFGLYYNRARGNLYPDGLIYQSHVRLSPSGAYGATPQGWYPSTNADQFGNVAPQLTPDVYWLVWIFDSTASGYSVGSFQTDKMISLFGMNVPAIQWLLPFGYMADQTAPTDINQLADPDPFTGSDLSFVTGSVTIATPLIGYQSFQ